MAKPINIGIAAGVAGLAGTIALLVGDLAASLSTPDYSLARDSISSLALTPIGWLQTIGFLALGLLLEVFVVGLLVNVGRARGFNLGIGLLALCGFGLLMIGAFPMDPAGATRTTQGLIHSVTAYTIALLFPISLMLLTPSLKSDPRWEKLFAYTLVAAVSGLAMVPGLFFLPNIERWFGLYERIMVANVMVWVAVAAVHLLRLSRRRQRQPGAC
ncbi:MAG: DUF998 domain-containing protein [Dehalococcoidia bacterium]